MHFIAIATFPRDGTIVKEVLSRRRCYTYPTGFTNVTSYLDAHGGRAIVHFETNTVESIQQYTADWPELTFDVFPVAPTEKSWEAYLLPRG